MKNNVNMNMEQWKKKVMNSLEGMERATPPEDLYDRIYASLESEPRERPVWSKWAAAAAVLFLLGFNLYGINEYVSATDEPEAYESSIISDYNLYYNE